MKQLTQQTHVPIENTEKKDPMDAKDIWQKAAIIFAVSFMVAGFLAYSLMYSQMDAGLRNKIIIGLGFSGFLFGAIGFMVINKTVGFRFMTMLVKLNKLKKRGYILLKIHTVSGRPQYRAVRDSPWIQYQYKENNVDIGKRVVSDPLAKYNDFGADITVMECTPNDIFPINRHTGTRITTSPELIEKQIIDASKTFDELQKYKKWVKYLTPALVVIAIALVVVFDLWRQSLAEMGQQVAQCYNRPKEATIITGGFVKVIQEEFIKWKKQ